MRDETNVEEEAEAPGWFYTDAISDNAVSFVEQHHAERADDPFFLYLAYTAPHWPLHAHEDDVARYRGRFDAGWDALREERLARLVKEGIVEDGAELAARDPRVPAWDDNDEKAWDARRMEVYAAQVDRMDRGIGQRAGHPGAARPARQHPGGVPVRQRRLRRGARRRLRDRVRAAAGDHPRGRLRSCRATSPA